MKGRHLEQAGVLIVKGSTSLRRFCWLQVNFSYGHCPVAHFGVSNGRIWPVVAVRGQFRRLALVGERSGSEGHVPGTAACSRSRP